MVGDMKYVLVTGTNSGLGLGICTRLIDDFLRSDVRSQSATTSSLTLIFTTRSKRKGEETLGTLRAHLAGKHAPPQQRRVHLRPENVDLTNLLSVRALARRLVDSDIPKLDSLILNAGVAGWSGLDWPDAILTIARDIRTATTWPRFKLGIAGLLTATQFPPRHNMATRSPPPEEEVEPPLGQLFCANVFGHYMLVHWLMPLIRACEAQTPARIVWVSSIEPQAHHLDEDDIQGLNSRAGYESTKRLVDTLALTYNQPSVAPSRSSFVATQTESTGESRSSSNSANESRRPVLSTPSMHTAHPGILTTTIIALPWIVYKAYYVGILLARIVGSVWATLEPYPAARTMTWLALAPMSEIDEEESKLTVSCSSTSSVSVSSSSSPSVSTSTSAIQSTAEKVTTNPPNNHGRVKWGTAATRTGTTSVRPTEVENWGLNGSGTPFASRWWAGTNDLGRVPGSKEATREDVEDFVALGQRLWRAMELLRRDWEIRIDRYDISD